jgi:NAD+ synthase (glutamine-hydrolysing)
MNIKLCQLDYTVGDLKGNSDKIISIINGEKDSKTSNILLFSELAVSGYPPLDLLDNMFFIKNQLEYVDKIIEATKGVPALVVFGYIEINPGVGKDLFNSALVCQDGKKLYNYRKRLLPTYDVFDEARYFEPGEGMGLFSFKEKRFGILICEDLWFQNKLYTLNPAQELFNAQADMILSLNASPSVVGKYQQKLNMVQGISRAYGIPIAYCNQSGGDDDIVFNGDSFVTNERGILIAHAKRFEEDILSIPMEATYAHAPFYSRGVDPRFYESNAQFFYEQAVCGIRSYIKKCGFKGVVIGESGGIDSAVVTALAADALGGENVVGITMPSQYSSEGSYKDSEILCENFGATFYTYQIKDAFDTILTQFCNIFPEEKAGLMEENLQARIRGQLLMSFSNRYGYLVLSTGNKSELSVGYCVSEDSCIRSNLGLLYAHELYENFIGNQIEYKGNRITNTFQSHKKEKYTVTTEIGNELSTSGDHEYKIYDPNKKQMNYKKARDIRGGDLLVMGIGSNVWGSNTVLPPFKYHKKNWDFKSANFKPPKDINEDLASFIGICIADGSYCGSYRIRTSKQYVASACLNTIEQLNLPDSCYKQTEKDDNGTFFVEISSVQFIAWLQFIGVKHGALNKDVPRIIREAPKNIIKAFLGGLLLDSSTNNNKERSEVTYRSSSLKLAREVHQLFLNTGILCFFRGHNAKSDNPGYEVYIPPYETHKLDSFPILKKQIIGKIVKNKIVLKNKSVSDYIYGVEEELRYIKDKIADDQRATLRRVLKEPIVKIGRNTLYRYMKMLPEGDYIRVKLLKKVCSDEYIIPCKDIKVETGEYTMYDFTVETIPEFNANGIDVHNCTIGGDMMGGLAPISDMYKMEVYAVAKYINQLHGKEMIPQAIIDKEPSAELAPNQRDTDSLPPYPVLDAILKYLIEGDTLPAEELQECKAIYDQSSEYVDKIIHLINRAEFKRRQAAITLKMHQKAFGYGRRIPVAQKWIRAH